MQAENPVVVLGRILKDVLRPDDAGGQAESKNSSYGQIARPCHKDMLACVPAVGPSLQHDDPPAAVSSV